MYKYYTLHRPIDIGSVPNNFIIFINYETKEKINNTSIEAWGEVYYENRLSQKEIKDYELKEEPAKEEKEKALQDIRKLDEIYTKIINFKPNNEELNIVMDRISDLVNKEIVKQMNNNLISHKEYIETTNHIEENEEESL